MARLAGAIERISFRFELDEKGVVAKGRTWAANRPEKDLPNGWTGQVFNGTEVPASAEWHVREIVGDGLVRERFWRAREIVKLDRLPCVVEGTFVRDLM